MRLLNTIPLFTVKNKTPVKMPYFNCEGLEPRTDCVDCARFSHVQGVCPSDHPFFGRVFIKVKTHPGESKPLSVLGKFFVLFERGICTPDRLTVKDAAIMRMHKGHIFRNDSIICGPGVDISGVLSEPSRIVRILGDELFLGLRLRGWFDWCLHEE